MKFFLMILLFTSSAFAGEFYPVGADNTDTTYVNKVDCENAENLKTNYQGCFDITGKDIRHFKVVLGVLVIDAAGVTAADADDKLASDNADLRATKAGERLTGAAACVVAVNAGGVLTNPDIQNCINVLVKQLFENQIAPGDL